MSLNKDRQFIQACQLADQGRFMESLNIFLDLEKNDPQDATLKLLIATSYFELKEYVQSKISSNDVISTVLQHI